MYTGTLKRLSRRATVAIEESDVLVSPAVVLELEYLHEVGRIAEGANAVVETHRAELGLRVCDLGFDRVVESSLKQTWTRDPFDRLIVGHAAAARRGLITADETIREHFVDALW